MDIKLVLSVLGTVIAVISYIPYLRDIYLGKTKPHAFSWFIWSLLGYIGAAAQFAGGGGIGAIIFVTTSTISFGIAAYTIKKYGFQYVTKSDWISFFVAMSAIPLWIISDGPILSLILIATIDFVGFLPTLRKAYSHPFEETLSTHALTTLKHIVTILAQRQYSFATVLYPFYLAFMTGFFVVELLVRRYQLKK